MPLVSLLRLQCEYGSYDVGVWAFTLSYGFVGKRWLVPLNLKRGFISSFGSSVLVWISCVWKKIGLLLALLRESLYQRRLGALPWPLSASCEAGHA